MDLDHDKELPDTHNEAVKLPPTQPVRFVWDQTTKKSSHNARMKARIIDDLIQNKGLYPNVPPEDFTVTKLDGVFEQAFTTFRQKFASQRRGKGSAQSRDDLKTQRIRRNMRKKSVRFHYSLLILN